MGKSAGKPPEPVNVVGAAQAEGAANKEAIRESALVNQINQITPYGSRTYSGEIGEPGRTETISLTPEGEATVQQQQQLAQTLSTFANQYSPQVTEALGQPLSFSGLPTIPTDYNESRGRVEQATYDRLTNLLRPDVEQNRQRLEVNLSNRGIPTTSRAYETATGNFERSAAEQFLQAANQAVLAGGQEQAQQFGQALTGRQQGIQEVLQQRAVPINELSALIQGAPAVNLPNFSPTAQYNQQPVDIGGILGLNQAGRNAAYQGQVAQANAGNQAAASAATAALMAGALIAASSRRIKRNKRPIAHVLPRLARMPVEAWEYIAEPGTTHIGPYAEDFKALFGVGDGETINLLDAVGVAFQGIKECGALIAHLSGRVARLEAT